MAKKLKKIDLFNLPPGASAIVETERHGRYDIVPRPDRVFSVSPQMDEERSKAFLAMTDNEEVPYRVFVVEPGHRPSGAASKPLYAGCHLALRPTRGKKTITGKLTCVLLQHQNGDEFVISGTPLYKAQSLLGFGKIATGVGALTIVVSPFIAGVFPRSATAVALAGLAAFILGVITVCRYLWAQPKKTS